MTPKIYDRSPSLPLIKVRVRCTALVTRRRSRRERGNIGRRRRFQSVEWELGRDVAVVKPIGYCIMCQTLNARSRASIEPSTCGTILLKTFSII